MEKLCVGLILSLCALTLVDTASISNALAIVGATSCGGTSRFIEMDITGCTVSPCQLTINTDYTVGITFNAGETSSAVQWQVWVYIPEGGVRLLQDLPADGTIVEGDSFRIANTIRLDQRYAGIPGEISILITNRDTGSRIMCGEFPIEVADI